MAGLSTASNMLAGFPINSAEGTIISEKLRELYSVVQQCQEERNRSEHNLSNITKTHERMQVRKFQT